MIPMEYKIRKILNKHFYLVSVVFAIPTYIFAYILCRAFGENPFKYFPVITIITLCAFSLGLFLFLTFQSATKEICKFCKNKLGDDYHEGNCMWRENNKNELWAHKRCIPNKLLHLWRSTEE